MKFYIKTGINLMIVCAVAAAALSLTYGITKGPIAMQQKAKIREANKKVMQKATSFKEIPNSTSPEKDNVQVEKVYLALNGNEILGYVASVHTRGYGGKILMVVGVDKDNKMTAINIVSNNETPGLGKSIEDPVWQKQFIGKSLKGPNESFTVKTGPPNLQIIALNGATISPTAVTKGVNAALHFVMENKAKWPK
jgi:electron transport complex protein RnfG